MCHYELGYPEDICSNLTLDINKPVEEKVQEAVNNFQMNANWIASVPIIFFSIIAGALSDEFGRKPPLLFPMMGNLLAMIIELFNYAYLDVLPVQFFYLDSIYAFFGGYAVYYLGMYSFVTHVTKPKERAHRLARLDGTELLGYVSGTLMSPLIFKKLGNYGNYGISAGLISIALAYLIFFVEEPIKKKLENSNQAKSIKNLLYIGISTPLLGMKSLFLKKRPLILKFLILLQFAWFFIYWFVIEVSFMRYLYMMLVFDNFTETDYAYFSVFGDLSSTFFLMLGIPFLNAKLKIHDALMLVIILAAEVACYASLPFATTLWQFYLPTFFGGLGYCKYSLVRSLLSKCISLDEVGKAFSILAVVAALGPVAGNPVFRQLYNATIDTFPGSIFLLAASITLVAMAGNFFIYTKRDKLLDIEEEPDNSDKKDIPTINGALETTNL